VVAVAQAVVVTPAVAVVRVVVEEVEVAAAVRPVVVGAVIPAAAGTPTVASPTDNDSKTSG
jgi:hypothetical protein